MIENKEVKPEGLNIFIQGSKKSLILPELGTAQKLNYTVEFNKQQEPFYLTSLWTIAKENLELDVQ